MCAVAPPGARDGPQRLPQRHNLLALGLLTSGDASRTDGVGPPGAARKGPPRFAKNSAGPNRGPASSLSREAVQGRGASLERYGSATPSCVDHVREHASGALLVAMAAIAAAARAAPRLARGARTFASDAYLGSDLETSTLPNGVVVARRPRRRAPHVRRRWCGGGASHGPRSAALAASLNSFKTANGRTDLRIQRDLEVAGSMPYSSFDAHRPHSLHAHVVTREAPCVAEPSRRRRWPQASAATPWRGSSKKQRLALRAQRGGTVSRSRSRRRPRQGLHRWVRPTMAACRRRRRACCRKPWWWRRSRHWIRYGARGHGVPGPKCLG